MKFGIARVQHPHAVCQLCNIPLRCSAVFKQTRQLRAMDLHSWIFHFSFHSKSGLVRPEGCLLLRYLTILHLAAQMPIAARIVFALENILFFAGHSDTPDKFHISERRLIFKFCGFMIENNEDL